MTVCNWYDQAIKKFTSGDTISVLDPKLERNPSNNLALEKVLEMAFQCLAPHRGSRPSMKKCSEILWGIRKDYRELLNTSLWDPSLCPLYKENVLGSPVSGKLSICHTRWFLCEKCWFEVCFLLWNLLIRPVYTIIVAKDNNFGSYLINDGITAAC